MDLYILDNQLRRVHLLDVYKSLIWTERWQHMGDFELEISNTSKVKDILKKKTMLAIDQSKRVMVCETIDREINSDGEDVLVVKGRSLEMILTHRAARRAMNSLGAEPVWSITNSPGGVARTMFNRVCRPPGLLHPDDVIPFITTGSPYPLSNIPELTLQTITWNQPPDTLYNAIQKICSQYHLGFRLTRTADDSKLYFDVYSGNDRTHPNNMNYDPEVPIVSLRESHDEIYLQSEISSVQDYKNVAYSLSQNDVNVVYEEDVYRPYEDTQGGPPYTGVFSGFDRHVLVHTYDPNDPDLHVQWPEFRQAIKALNAHRPVELQDFQLNPYSEIQYEIDYYLGDIIQIVDSENQVYRKRVTEYIFVSDAEGVRHYPSLDEPIIRYIPPASNPQ